MQDRVAVEGVERKAPTQATEGSTSTGPNAPAYWSGHSRGGGTTCTGTEGWARSAVRTRPLIFMSLTGLHG